MFTDKDIARFWKHVHKGKADECWTVKGLKGLMFAVFRDGKRTNYSVRRFAWALERGEMLSDDLCLLVVCGHDQCVNPDHLLVCRRGTHPLAPAKPPRARPGIYYLAWMAGFDLKMLNNGRYKVVRRCQTTM